MGKQVVQDDAQWYDANSISYADKARQEHERDVDVEDGCLSDDHMAMV